MGSLWPRNWADAAQGSKNAAAIAARKYNFIGASPMFVFATIDMKER
jgi:hypothetical protein